MKVSVCRKIEVSASALFFDVKFRLINTPHVIPLGNLICACCFDGSPVYFGDTLINC